MGATAQTIQHNSATGTGTTIAATFGSNTTTGNLVFVGCSWGTTNVTPTCADSQGNTYALYDKVWDATNGQGAAIFVAPNITGGTTPTVTVTFGGSSVPDRSIEIWERSGHTTSTPVDQHTGQLNTSPGTGTDGATSGTASTTTNADDDILGKFTDITGTSYTVSVGTSFSLDHSYTTASTQPIRLESRNVTSTGGYAATFTLGSNKRCIVHVMILKNTGGAAPTLPQIEHANSRGAFRGVARGMR